MIDHPLVGSLKELSNDEISAKIAELNKKLGFALRTGNAELCHQLRLALTNFTSEQQNRLSKNANTPFDEVIDIR
jgi:hypothetical protein